LNLLAASSAAPRRSPVKKNMETATSMTTRVERTCSVSVGPVVILPLLQLHAACQVMSWYRTDNTGRKSCFLSHANSPCLLPLFCAIPLAGNEKNIEIYHIWH
jgi:hypothetical protein